MNYTCSLISCLHFVISRCGKVHHPIDSLAALPPVPGVAGKNVVPNSVKTVQHKRMPLRSTRTPATTSTRVTTATNSRIKFSLS